MNALKQKHKEFIVWYIKQLGYDGLKLDNFEMTVYVFKPTNIRSDCDNYVVKFWNDGFVESSFILDDSFKCMKSFTIKVGVDKENPRTEIIIRTLD